MDGDQDVEDVLVTIFDPVLEELMERAEVNHAQRGELRSDPLRSREYLAYALARPKIRNPAAYAVARYRASLRPAAAEPDVEDVQPRDVATLDRALSFARSYGAPAVAIAAIERELVAARAAELVAHGD